MAVLAVHWGWFRFAACIYIAFYGILRPGEVLKAFRRDFVLPMDLVGETCERAFLRIQDPKGRHRGRGRVQHASFEERPVIAFLERKFGHYVRDAPLYPISPGSFRRKWDRLLRHIGVLVSVRLTPGSLRSGGAVAEYRKGTGLTRICWRMCLRHMVTLEHYIQEVAGETLFAELSFSVQKRIQILSDMFDPVLSAC